MLPETHRLTYRACDLALEHEVPVKILTKSTYGLHKLNWECSNKRLVAFGFTLTGHDELEPNASSNAERIAAMRKLHNAGFKTFSSIEPIIDIASSEAMILSTLGFCDLYKIGLMTGGGKPEKDELFHFVGRVTKCIEEHGAKVYWKESVRQYFDFIDFDKSPCVDSRYNLFGQK